MRSGGAVGRLAKAIPEGPSVLEFLSLDPPNSRERSEFLNG
jgi:hypothetical protein